MIIFSVQNIMVGRPLETVINDINYLKLKLF